uniref:GlgB protein n=1 Tax=Fopius arisanus TaxID=64838 RepID=A0A0C9RED1_9HYME
MQHQAIRPIVPYRKSTQKRPPNKRLKGKKCKPLIVACEPTDDPTRFSLPLWPNPNRGIKRPPAVVQTRPHHGLQNNYHPFYPAPNIPSNPYGSHYDISPLARQQEFSGHAALGAAYGHDDNSYLKPEAFDSFEDCIRLYGREACYAAMGQFGVDNHHRSPYAYNIEATADLATNNYPFGSQHLSGYTPGAPAKLENSGYYGKQGYYQPHDSTTGPQYNPYHNIGYDNYLDNQKHIVGLTNDAFSTPGYGGYSGGSQVGRPYWEASVSAPVVNNDKEIIGSTSHECVECPGDETEYSNIPEQELPEAETPKTTMLRPGEYTDESRRKEAEYTNNFIAENKNQNENSYNIVDEKEPSKTNVSMNYHENNYYLPQAPEPEGNHEFMDNPIGTVYNQNYLGNIHQFEDAGRTPAAPQEYSTPEDLCDYRSTVYPQEDYNESPVITNPYEKSKISVVYPDYQDAQKPEEYFAITEQDSQNFPKPPIVEGLKNDQQSEVLHCPPSETGSPTAEGHLRDLEALTGLSIEDSKILRGTIYEAIHRVVSDMKESVAAKMVPSPCDIIAAPEPTAIPGMENPSLVGHLLSSPFVRNFVVGTIKGLIPQVTGISRDSGLGKLTDALINRSLSVVIGEENVPEDIGEPSLGLVNENVASVPDQLMSLLMSVINQPGIGLENAKLPAVQNIIVNALGNILRRSKNVVNNAVIWDALRSLINSNNRGPVINPVVSPEIPPQKLKPMIPRPLSPGFDTKPLPYIPVTEHYLRNGGWYEKSATVGYNGELPVGVLPQHSENVGAPQNGVHMDEHENQQYITEENTPTRYHSPEDIVLEYIKNHPAEQANLGPPKMASPGQHFEIDDNVSVVPITDDQLKKSHYTDLCAEEGDFIPSKNDQVHGGSIDFPVSSSTYFGKIAFPNSDNIDCVKDLEGAQLFYIGDGVRLPLTIKKMPDGSLALMLSDKICESFISKNCPCYIPTLGHVVQQSNAEVKESRSWKGIHSRGIRSTTINDNDTTEKSMAGENAPEMTVMPVEKFAKKYNLTLNLGDHPKIDSWKNKRINLLEAEKKSELNDFEDKSKGKMSTDSDKNEDGIEILLNLPDNPGISPEDNQYIQDLLSIHDVPENDRAAIVINALDGLLQQSSQDNTEDQVDNPIRKRIQYFKEKLLEHGKYKYQKPPEDAAKMRMDVAKNIIHWLKKLIVK